MKQLFFATSLFALFLFASCVDSINSSTDTILSTDAQIKSVSLLVKDSVTKSLDKVFFSINQKDGIIENLDSLPVSAKTSLAKLKYKYIKVKMDFVGASKVMIVYGGGGQPFEYPKVDSIDFTQIVKIEVTAADGVTLKTYEFKLNIHNQDPEVLNWKSIAFSGWNTTPYHTHKTVAFKTEFLTYLKGENSIQLFASDMSDGAVWQSRTSALQLTETAQIESMTLFANKLYVTTSAQELWASADGLAWSKVELPNAIYSIYGSIVTQSGTNQLIVLSKENGNYRLAAVSETGNLTFRGDDILPDDFPVSGFGRINKAIGLSEKLTIIAGKDKSDKLLNSVQQIYWDNSGFHCAYNIENGNNWFPAIEAPNAYFYDNKMVISCGRDLTKEYKTSYYSTNYGLSWAEDSTHLFPTAYSERANCSVIVDSQNFIWIFGGQNKFVDRTFDGINEIWRGKLNRLGFIRQ